MEYQMDLSGYREGPRFGLGDDFCGSSPAGERIGFNNYYMEKNGEPFYPVSGEFHFSRMDDGRWEDELIKMRMGGKSTRNWRANILLNVENVRANRVNGYFSCFAMMLPKYLFKIWGFILYPTG